MPLVLVTACWGQTPWTPWYTCLISVLVLMFNPSFGTHFSSQFCCTSFIWIINIILRPALIPQHSLHSAMPCQGQAPGPPVHIFIPVLVHMFNLCFATNVLLKLSKLHFSLHKWHGTRCAQPACKEAPWTSQCTCLIPVLTHTFYLNHPHNF